MKKIVLFSLFVFFPGMLLLAQSQVQLSGWLASFNTIKTGKKTSIHLDVQLRSNDQIEKLQTILFRPGFNYHIAANKIATAGYALIENRTVLRNFEEYVAEHRLWEQFIITQKITNIGITHRFRVEQRFIKKLFQDPTDAIYDEKYFSQRLRYFVRAFIPVSSRKKFEHGFFLAVQNEVFVNLTNRQAVNNKFFDQNRLFGAFGRRFSPKCDFEIGFMNQYISGRNTLSITNRVVQMALYLRP